MKSTPTETTMPALEATHFLASPQIDEFSENGFILLRNVLSPDEIAAYGSAIRQAAMAQFAKNGMAESFGRAFLQTLNLRYHDRDVMRFATSRRLGHIAAQLLRAPQVRIYHDQALFKNPGGSDTAWHQDQYFWPLVTDQALGMWMPLVDCSAEMGGLRYVQGSHRRGNLGQKGITGDGNAFFEDFIRTSGSEISQMQSLRAGDALFHLGWTIHGAPGNRTDRLREAMVVTFYPANTRVDEFTNEYRRGDAEHFLGGRQPGEWADSELNPVVYSV